MRTRTRVELVHPARRHELHGENAVRAQMLEVSLLGVGTVLRPGWEAWAMVKQLRQATQNEYAPPPNPPRRRRNNHNTTSKAIKSRDATTHSRGNSRTHAHNHRYHLRTHGRNASTENGINHWPKWLDEMVPVFDTRYTIKKKKQRYFT